MSREPRSWVSPKLDLSSRLWLVFIPWIREKTVFTVVPRERQRNIRATWGISLFGSLSCVLRLQWSNGLKNNKRIWGFLCSQSCFLDGNFDVSGSDSIFVHQCHWTPPDIEPGWVKDAWPELPRGFPVDFATFFLLGYSISFVWALLQSKYLHQWQTGVK